MDEFRLIRNQLSHTYSANDLKTALRYAEDIPKEVRRFLKLAFTFVTEGRWMDVSAWWLECCLTELLLTFFVSESQANLAARFDDGTQGLKQKPKKKQFTSTGQPASLMREST